jgi:hypothetical protein
MSEKVKIIPNPEAVPAEEVVETKSKPEFPTKLVRNILIGAAGVAITGYVAYKIQNKEDNKSDDSCKSDWETEYVPVPQTSNE